MEMMMHPRDEAAMKENAKTRDLWEQAYADVQGDETEEEMFKRFEHAYAARVGARPMGPPMPISAASMPMAQQRGGWANEFEQESRFAEFEQVYRTSPTPQTHPFFHLPHFLSPFMVKIQYQLSRT